MIIDISHDNSGICVVVHNGGRSITMRLVQGHLRKTASAGGPIPKQTFKAMIGEGRQAYAAHHCPQCPTPAPPSHSSFQGSKHSLRKPHWLDQREEEED